MIQKVSNLKNHLLKELLWVFTNYRYTCSSSQPRTYEPGRCWDKVRCSPQPTHLQPSGRRCWSCAGEEAGGPGETSPACRCTRGLKHHVLYFNNVYVNYISTVLMIYLICGHCSMIADQINWKRSTTRSTNSRLMGLYCPLLVFHYCAPDPRANYIIQQYCALDILLWISRGLYLRSRVPRPKSQIKVLFKHFQDIFLRFSSTLKLW